MCRKVCLLLRISPISTANSACGKVSILSFAALAVWAVLMWFALLHFATSLFLALGPDNTLIFFSACLFMPLSLFIMYSAGALKNCPVKLAPADIAYVVGSPVSASGIVFSALSGRLLMGALCALAFGYLLGECLQVGLGVSLPSLTCALFCALLVLVIQTQAWSMGMLRFIRRGKRFSFLCGAVVLVPLLFLLMPLYATLGGFVANETAVASMLTQVFPLLCCALIFIAIVLLILLAFASPLISVAKIVDKNALYTKLYALRNMHLYNLSGYGAIRRRKRIALRGPLLRLPSKRGGAALFFRAALSHLRQYEGIPSLLFWGALIVPAGTYLLLAPPDTSLVLWALWISLLLICSQGAQEMTRVFRDDVRVRMVRDMLPFSTLKLLVLDSLPAFIAVVLTSLIVVTVFWWARPELFWSLLFSVLIHTLLALCSALENLKQAHSSKHLNSELAVVVCVLMLFLVSLVHAPLLSAFALGIGILALVSLIRFSKE